MFKSFIVTDPHSIFAALADPTRVKILLLVRDLQLSVGELADLLDQSQPRVSRHVRILVETGLLTRQKEGAFVFVGLAGDDIAAEVAALVARLAAGEELIGRERERLARVRAERQKAVDDWFRANAHEWDLLRRLGGQDGEVEAALLAVAARPGRLLDIGTGTGRLLELLAPRAETATGVDRSPEMLRLARAKLTGDGGQSAELKQADMHHLPFVDGCFDTVTMQHVLHFADDPGQVLKEAARVVAPGGRLLLVDHEAHGHEDLRTRYRHVRLGFGAEQGSALLRAAGLSPCLLSRHPGTELAVLVWEGRKA